MNVQTEQVLTRYGIRPRQALARVSGGRRYLDRLQANVIGVVATAVFALLVYKG